MLNEAIPFENIEYCTWFSETRGPYIKVSKRKNLILGGIKENTGLLLLLFMKAWQLHLIINSPSTIKTKAEQYVNIYADNRLYQRSSHEK